MPLPKRHGASKAEVFLPLPLNRSIHDHNDALQDWCDIREKARKPRNMMVYRDFATLIGLRYSAVQHEMIIFR